MSAIGFLGDLLAAFGKSFEPLEESLAAGESFSALLAEFGWSMDPGSDVNVVQSALGKLPNDLESIPRLIAALEDSGEDMGALVPAVKDLETLVKDVADTVHGLSATTPSAVWPAPMNSAPFWTTFPADLLENLFYRYLQSNVPKLFALLQLIGALSEDFVVPVDSGRIAYVRRGVRWDRVVGAVSQPEGILADVYGWGGKLDARRLLESIRGLAIAFGVPAGSSPARPEILSAYYDPSALGRGSAYELTMPVYYAVTDIGGSLGLASVELAALPIPPAGVTSVAPVGLALYPRITGSADTKFDVVPGRVTAELKGGFDAEGSIRAELRPGAADVFVDTQRLGGTQIDAAAILDSKPGTPWILLGRAGGIHLELKHAHAAMRARGTVPDVEFIAELAADSAALVLDVSEGDGFLQSVLNGSPQRAEFGVALTWSSKHGLRFGGQTTLETTIPVQQSIGGLISLDSLYVSFRAKGDGTGARLVTAATGGISIGPIAANIQQVGLSLDLNPVPPNLPAGNLGMADIGFAFKPPDGVGLAISAPGVSGVGFLEHDPAKGEYRGVLSLTLAAVSVSGVGLLTTRLAGHEGFSLVLLASAQFPPVQLGFGFALTGLGGLVGANRTMNVPALQQLARAGGLDTVMFPADLVHNAPRVAAELGSYFPPAEGQHVFGPTAHLVWGPTGFLTAEVAVLIELPTPLRVALVGFVHLTLPQASAPVADITLDVLGVLDLSARTLSIDAGLRDSRIAGFTLTGQAALRAGWGQNPTFVLAIGGFNPHFAAPPGFPALQRVALSLGGADPRFRLSAYFAITSNTLQLGARAELYASAGPAAVSASLSFDALVQYHPFQLELDLTISAAVLLDGSPVLSLGLELHVTGPSPWHVSGKAHFSILFFSFTVPINLTVGPPAPVLTPAPVDVMKLLADQLADLHSWSTAPPGGSGLVVLRGGSAVGASAVHPLGSLTVRQRAVPLGQRIDRFGADPLSAAVELDVGEARLCGVTVPFSAVTDFFAPAQFLVLSDDDKLSAPSFEPMTAGVTIGTASGLVPEDGSDRHLATRVNSTRQWTTLILDIPDPSAGTKSAGTPMSGSPPVAATVGSSLAPGAAALASQRGLIAAIDPVGAPPSGLLSLQLGAAAASVSGAYARGRARYAGPSSAIALTSPSYAVAKPTNTILQSLTGEGSAPLTFLPSRASAVSQLDAAALAAVSALVVYSSELAGSTPMLTTL